MTPHQRTARINKLRKELMRPALIFRPKKANEIRKELAALVVQNLKAQIVKLGA